MMAPQAEFINDTTTRFIGFMGGYRAGKTFAACMKAISLAYHNVGYNGIMCEPTGSLVEAVLIPEMRARLEECGFVENETYYCYNSATNPRFVLRFPKGNVTIFLRSAENYKRIVGISAAWFICDEFDTSGYEICSAAWKNLCARLTKGNVMQGCVTSTKEGFQWCYNFFEEGTAKLIAEGKPVDRRSIDISVVENPFVDDEYVEIQRSQMTPKHFEAFVENKYVNFTTGSVYYCFNRELNRTAFTVSTKANEPLHIGVDFNVGKMAAIVSLMDGIGKIYVVDEIFGCENTMALAEEIKKRYPRRFIQLYVDTSGYAEKTNASQTDIQILRFHFGQDNVFAYKKHLTIDDRVGSVNARFLAADKTTRMLYVNDITCPRLTKNLEAQGYDKTGKPDKANDVDHLPDSLGYLIGYKFPIKSRVPSITLLNG
jgi:hypothetical protein